MNLLRRFLAVLGAAVVSTLAIGIVFGVVWRALMRVFAIVAKDPLEYSHEGSLAIVGISVMGGLIGAILLAALRRRRWIGYLVAVIGLFTLNVAMLIGQLAELGRMDGLQRVLTVILMLVYLGMLTLQVTLLGRFSSWLRRRFGPLPATPSGQP